MRPMNHITAMSALLLFLVTLITGCAPRLTQEQNLRLWKAYQEKNYFVLDNLMSKIKFNEKNPKLLLFRATLNNVFNRPEESTRDINVILQRYASHFGDSIVRDLYMMKAENSGRLQDYASAYRDNSFLISSYAGIMDSAERESLKDDNAMWSSLVDAPKMEIMKPADSRIPLKRDIAGLFNVPVAINGDTVDFVFDTGANFSVISKSLANKYHASFRNKKVNVGTSTGRKVEADVGLLNFRMGNLAVKNAVFLILPDSLLSFAGGQYIIKGIVGLPVMLALQEIIIREDKTLIIPEKTESSQNRNFAFDHLTPLIMVTYKTDTLPFHFDTGANTTDLYSSFFNRYRNEILKHATKQVKSTGGVGGIVKSEVFVLDSVVLCAGDSECLLDSLIVSERDLKGDEVKHVYGNFGQDYIRKFKEMRIDFSAMHISFSNNTSK